MANPHFFERIRNLRVELEITPDWWKRFGGRTLGCNEQAESMRSADLIARSMVIAVAAFSTCEVRVSRNFLKLIVYVSTDTTLAVVSEQAGILREQMNGLALENPGSQ